MSTSQDIDADVALELERYRGELIGYCYRMLGSASEAEDAVQDTFTKAWRNMDRFEGRSSLRTWLYRIASNACFDQLRSSQRRARPMDLSDSWAVDGPIGDLLPEVTWIQPVPDRLVHGSVADPADVAEGRDSIRLAFISALQHLPARQRAALILCEVLRWPAVDVADLLDTTVASVNSALQRARATLDSVNASPPAAPAEPVDQDLLDRYLDAFERYDIDALSELVRQDAIQSMPPYELWLEGRDDIIAWWVGPGAECEGSRLVRAADANGCPAFGQYRPSGPGGRHEPWALQVLMLDGDTIGEFAFFLDTETLFPIFGLPQHPDDPLP
ncbi:sigma-70 family RNA polymerase sigma factor [Aquihabitans sp. McL0605]|uniref:sigma-70 family RNA polymerase sigma factor n=1 Tax=Aquihabitans sp. McL0605 TaxID=3415671 RepID=UPI003CF7CE25